MQREVQHLVPAGMFVTLGLVAVVFGTADLAENRIRGAALGLAAAAQWLANFVISRSFPKMAEIGLSFAYGFYTTFALLSFFFVLRFVPETKGRQLEDMG